MLAALLFAPVSGVTDNFHTFLADRVYISIDHIYRIGSSDATFIAGIYPDGLRMA